MPTIPANSIDTDPQARVAWLVSFHTDAGVWRYAGWDADIEADGETYTALPAIMVEFHDIHGRAGSSPVYLTMPPRAPVLGVMPGQRERVRVEFRELNVDDAASLRRSHVLWVQRVTENPLGRRDLLKIELGGLKLFIKDVAAGAPCDSACDNVFGGWVCRYDLESVTFDDYSLRVRAGSVVEFHRTGINTTANWFHRGHIKIGGLRIAIRDDLGQQGDGWRRVVLDAAPPTSWGNAVDVTISPGCNKTLERCRELANEANFRGLGHKMPSHDPNTELPADYEE